MPKIGLIGLRLGVPLACVFGSGGPAFPSAIRGMIPQVPAGLDVEEGPRPLEENGFTIADFTEQDVTLRCLRWRREPVTSIDTLPPFRVTRLARG